MAGRRNTWACERIVIPANHADPVNNEGMSWVGGPKATAQNLRVGCCFWIGEGAGGVVRAPDASELNALTTAGRFTHPGDPINTASITKAPARKTPKHWRRLLWGALIQSRLLLANQFRSKATNGCGGSLEIGRLSGVVDATPLRRRVSTR